MYCMIMVMGVLLIKSSFFISKDPTCEKARVGLQCGQCVELPRGPLDLLKDSEALRADEELDVSFTSSTSEFF